MYQNELTTEVEITAVLKSSISWTYWSCFGNLHQLFFYAYVELNLCFCENM